MSTGYLSRLESGARQPTERAVAHLAAQLGISPAELAESTATSLAQNLTLATGLAQDEAGRRLAEALKAADGEDPLLRWQALWQVAEWRRRRQEFAEQRTALRELVAIGTGIGLPELRARSLAELARCLRNLGEVAEAVDTATGAYELAVREQLPAHVVVPALLALVSALAEAGRIPEAVQHGDELLAAVEGQSGPRWAEAQWTVAALRLRQGDVEGAAKLMDEAVRVFDGRDDLDLWMRLRTAAARLDLMKVPPAADSARRRIAEVEAAMPFAGNRGMEQQLLAQRARVAVIEGDAAEAREALTRLEGFDDTLSYQDRVRLDVLRNQVLLMTGERDAALAGLRALAEQAQAGGNMDVAAEIWRMIAESLAG
jgi:transcriptional regulator with XRE-family HTH domain